MFCFYILTESVKTKNLVPSGNHSTNPPGESGAGHAEGGTGGGCKAGTQLGDPPAPVRAAPVGVGRPEPGTGAAPLAPRGTDVLSSPVLHPMLSGLAAEPGPG